jgi:hypothetical protein
MMEGGLGSTVDGAMQTIRAGDRIPMSWEEYEVLGPAFRGEYIDGVLRRDAEIERRRQR